MKKKLMTATGPELARILGVTHQAVYKGVKTGRLSKCVLGKAREGRVFEIYTACIEWENSRDYDQVRGSSSVAEPPEAPAGIGPYPPLAESRQIKEYYEALNERVLLLKQTESLVDLARVESEVFGLARQLRDRLQEIPEKMRFHLLSAGVDDVGAGQLIKWLETTVHEVLLETSELDFSSIAKKPRNWDLEERGDQ